MAVPPHQSLVSEEDHVLARDIAAQTGQLLLSLRESSALEGVEPEQLRREADRRANDLIFELLSSRLARGDRVLSEENPDDGSRIDSERVWIVDPLDGSREFAELERTDWAVHVGLVINSQPVVGAVALPALGMVSHTGDPPRPALQEPSLHRILVSRSRPPQIAYWLRDRIGCDLVRMGSAGAKAMAVVRGDADAYIHAGGQFEWDSCAPVAVAPAAGLHATRLDGTPLRYNQSDSFLPDLLICRPSVVDRILSAVEIYTR